MDEATKAIITLLSSNDFRYRFVGEFCELCIRIEKLQDFLKMFDEAPDMQKKFTQTSDDAFALLREQHEVMMKYRDILFKRMKIILGCEQNKTACETCPQT